MEEVRKGYDGKDSLPAALCEAKLAGPLPLIKGDSYFFEGGSRKEREGRKGVFF